MHVMPRGSSSWAAEELSQLQEATWKQQIAWRRRVPKKRTSAVLPILRRLLTSAGFMQLGLQIPLASFAGNGT
ncbi:hypothetical protein Y1Q_0006695 [Alligator mississippiensis]|uniref:Uncharacterized protein n=1 Tax=Alligator mississippiensis TaxID=8496 RepID=A0A151NSI6_ALLMI|nr:hypothetical protein Y1Q_0006695 [Alligator mississippiensis]